MDITAAGVNFMDTGARNKELALGIGHRYPLDAAARAHRDIESRATTGKLLLLPRSYVERG